MVSPPALEPRAQMIAMAVLSFRNLTDPSAIRMFAPPACMLLRLKIPGFILSPAPLGVPLRQLGYFGFGGWTMVPSESPKVQNAQFIPVVFESLLDEADGRVDAQVPSQAVRLAT